MSVKFTNYIKNQSHLYLLLLKSNLKIMFLNKLALIIFFLFTTFSLLAQQAFEKSISTPGGFEVYSISNTDDNGFAITGKKGNGVLLIKFD